MVAIDSCSHTVIHYAHSEDKAGFYIAELTLAIEHLHKLGIIYRYVRCLSITHYVYPERSSA